MTNSHSVSFRYSKEDILNYVVETLALQKGKCFGILLLILALFVLAIAAFTVKFNIFGVLIIVIALLIVPVTIFLMFLNVLGTISHLTDCVFTVENNSLIIASNLGVEKYLVKDLFDIVATKTFILIYIYKKTAYGIPIRAFSDEEKASMFLNALKLHFD